MTITETPRRTFWNVAFFYRSFTITDTIAAIDADDAITLAANRICDYLDIDVDTFDAQADDTGEPAGSDDE
jgi:hypothetical protein